MKTPVFINPVRHSLPALARLAGGVVVLSAGLVLLGWTVGFAPLIRLVPTRVAMNPMTALLFACLGLSLWRLSRGPVKSLNREDVVALGLALVVVLVGVLRLADYCFNYPWQIEEILFAHRVGAVGVYPPSEMAPNTAVCFVCCGLALLLFDVEIRWRFRPGQALVVVAGGIALLALIGYSYHVLSLYRVGTQIPMSLNTAIAFAVFCLGFLAARPNRGLMTVLTSATTGGTVARRLLPMALLMPWFLGALLLVGEQVGYYEREFAIAIFAIASILVFTALIYWNATLLYEVDVERQRTERRLAVQHNSTRVLAETVAMPEAMRGVLQAVCRSLDWQVGMMWQVEPAAGTARCTEVWSADESTTDFTRTSFTVRRGEELPGEIWAVGHPSWTTDLTRAPHTPRTLLAARAGLRAVIGFPVRLGPEILGVMEFFSRRTEPPDALLLEMLSAVGNQVGQFIERAKAEQQLRQTSADLARSNTDLQQFAYVASHDLTEPLRMVTSYLQLLQQRYQAKLEPAAHEFIGFAVDGAQRMQALIQDLLAYSRVDMRGRPFEPTDTDQVLRAAVSNLKVAIEESGATIVHPEPLPQVRADPVQLTQVFQNLIGNGLKFHGTTAPRIEVAARSRDGEWVFSVRDNGIGIEPKNFERIFVIFQRLHTRREYSGTGIGLAICKKIVERHGGRIWVDSSPGQGATFFFTLPLMKNGG